MKRTLTVTRPTGSGQWRDCLHGIYAIIIYTSNGTNNLGQPVAMNARLEVK